MTTRDPKRNYVWLDGSALHGSKVWPFVDGEAWRLAVSASFAHQDDKCQSCPTTQVGDVRGLNIIWGDRGAAELEVAIKSLWGTAGRRFKQEVSLLCNQPNEYKRFGELMNAGVFTLLLATSSTGAILKLLEGVEILFESGNVAKADEVLLDRSVHLDEDIIMPIISKRADYLAVRIEGTWAKLHLIYNGSCSSGVPCVTTSHGFDERSKLPMGLEYLLDDGVKAGMIADPRVYVRQTWAVSDLWEIRLIKWLLNGQKGEGGWIVRGNILLGITTYALFLLCFVCLVLATKFRWLGIGDSTFGRFVASLALISVLQALVFGILHTIFDDPNIGLHVICFRKLIKDEKQLSRFTRCSAVAIKNLAIGNRIAARTYGDENMCYSPFPTSGSIAAAQPERVSRLCGSISQLVSAPWIDSEFDRPVMLGHNTIKLIKCTEYKGYLHLHHAPSGESSVGKKYQWPDNREPKCFRYVRPEDERLIGAGLSAKAAVDSVELGMGGM
jgi:hypothetical protein